MKPFKIYENFRKMTRKNASNIYEVTNIIPFPTCAGANVLVSEGVMTHLCVVW